MADDSTYLKKAILQLSDGAISAGALVALGVVGGSWLDGKLHTSPWFTLSLALLGGGLGLGRLIRKALDVVNDQSAPAVTSSRTKQAETGNPESGPGQRKPYQQWDDEDTQ